MSDRAGGDEGTAHTLAAGTVSEPLADPTRGM